MRTANSIFLRIWQVALLTLVLFVSCSKKDSSQVYLKIGSNLWPGYEPYYLAEHKGYYRDKHIRPVRLSSATQVARAYRNGQIDAACLTLNEVLSLREFVDDFEIVVINDTSSGGDALVVKPEIKKPKDIEGKRIGVEASALGAYVYNRIVQIHQLDVSKIKIIPLEVHEHVHAFVNNEVDAVITFEPVIKQLVSKGGKILFDSTEIPGEITDVTIVRRSFAKQNPQLIVNLLNGWFAGINNIANMDDDTRSFLKEKLSLSDAGLVGCYKGLELPYWQQNLKYLGSKRFIKNAELIESIMLKGSFLKKKKDFLDLTNTAYLEALND